MKKPQFEWVMLSLLLINSQSVLAGNEQSNPVDETPSIELLEFLGGWVSPEGDYYDPLLLSEDLQNQSRSEVKEVQYEKKGRENE